MRAVWCGWCGAGMVVLGGVAVCVAVVVWWLAYRLSGISAVGSLMACAGLLVALWGLEPEGLSLGVAAVAVVLLRHRENLRRLLEGTENRSNL